MGSVIHLHGTSKSMRLGFHIEPWHSPSGNISAKIDVTFLVEAPTQGDRLWLAHYLHDVSEFMSRPEGASLFGGEHG